MAQPLKKARNVDENEETPDQPQEAACEAPVCKIVKRVQEKTPSSSTSPSPSEDDEDMRRDWICCDVCEKWYHYSCVEIEEWEILIIDKYHCPSCLPQHGPSIPRKIANRHRFEFYKANVDHLKPQTGTPKWVDEFVLREKDYPEPPPGMVKILENGHELQKDFSPDEVWSIPYKIKNKEGLGMKVPGSGFGLADVVKIMGRNRSVDTIDVYAQNTYPMTLGRFLDLFESNNRDRLYNILSLEFSTCPEMADLIAPPSVVGEISWVHRFWPEVMHTAYKHLHRENDFTDELKWIKHHNRATENYDPYDEHQKARPDVALFCLAGMGGSFTDYHIDFGGSSVWYNVFKGEKIFYIIEPTKENIAIYHQHQLSPSRHENFLGDQEGVKTYRVVVKEGETLLIPSGWIHAVYTPVDSLVFGGNFLHSQNLKMQIMINSLEEEQKINVRFRYPSFELCNRYAASIILQMVRKCRKSDTRLPKNIEHGMQTLISELRRWDKLEAKRLRKRAAQVGPAENHEKPDKVKKVLLSNPVTLQPVSNPVIMAPISPIKPTSPVERHKPSSPLALQASSIHMTVPQVAVHLEAGVRKEETPSPPRIAPSSASLPPPHLRTNVDVESIASSSGVTGSLLSIVESQKPSTSSVPLVPITAKSCTSSPPSVAKTSPPQISTAPIRQLIRIGKLAKPLANGTGSAPQANMSDCEGEEEQFDSALGTKEFWDNRYNLELSNFNENGDEGEVWFGRSAENRIIKFLLEEKIDKESVILDVGTGNGSMLRRLREKGFTNLAGIDYSEGSIELSKHLAEQDDYDGEVEIEFRVGDLLKTEPDEELRDRFDVVLDKGTWDAISLAGDRNERLRNYRNSIVAFMKSNDMADMTTGPRYFIICSCNFTKEELVELFECEDLEFETEVAANHTISFGGRVGVTSTVVVFRKDKF
ncbi:hypothetical protein QR680_008343 [Steinernema hermaphroditum]|uniref:Protein-lysine N-methyltransferase QR680_008343 n=1 Tax=Steinernema hermaphroditum TaxID=289476 RepID=A0AA39M7H2_9BILA|nr:hypothetical protein QR680_008343 [Steinernema hermaphroditum]